jgi:alcohol dehydrogenase
MAVNGRALTCGSTAGHLSNFDIRFIWFREIEIIGSRAYLPEDTKACLDFVAQGQLKPVVEKELQLEDAAEGVRMLEERRVFGKIIVHV